MPTNDIASLRGEIQQWRREARDEAKRAMERIHMLERNVFGTDDEHNPGIKLRVDRLTQSERKRDKFLWIVLGASVTAAVGWLGHLIMAAITIHK